MLNIFWSSKTWKIIKFMFFILIGILFPPSILIAIIVEYVRKGADK